MDPLDQPISDSINIRTSNYFPLMARFGGIVFIVLGLLLVVVNIFVALLFVIGGLFVVTAHYRLKVDFGRGTYFDYSWVLGFKMGERGRFERIEYIYINKNKVSQTVRVRVASTSFDRYDYNGYLKFSENQKIHLRSDANKKTVVRHMEVLAAKLKCQIRDYSED
jgi:hypothetical protein